LAEILDDAVMHQRHARGGMRMRVIFGGRAMGGPARMADAGAPGERMLRQGFGQLRQFARRAAALDMPAGQRGDARGVIAAIFQAAQRLEDKRGRVVASRDADDSAHGSNLYTLSSFDKLRMRILCNFQNSSW